MNTHRIRRQRLALLVALLIAALPAAAAKPVNPNAAGTPANADRSAPGPDESSPSNVASSDMDSSETRDQLSNLLRRFPPELGMVLKLDPSLLRSQSYLAAYPQLATFVAAHPEVAHHPEFFFERISTPHPYEPESPTARMGMDILSGLLGFSVFLVVTGVLAWLVKTFIAQRRWSHLSRVQTEAHNKLLDRLASSQELLAYIQSSSGRRFLESAPIPLEDGRTAVSAPIGRMLWSVQVGLVLVAAGVGLQLIRRGVSAEISQPLFAAGMFAISIGIGFVLSAIVSFVISRKLGLWSPAAPVYAGGDRGAE